jgi:RNA polymerase sigma-70 factor (ECF subfamily)
MDTMDPETERSVVERLRHGGTGALDEVFAAFHTRIFSFLLRLSRRREVAEDLAEETWLRAVAHARRLRPDSRLAPWLFTIARNAYISYCRARLVETTWAADLLSLWPAGSPCRSPFEETAANEFERRLEAAIAALPLRLREVVLLVGIEGLPQAEAAAICGISPAALRQRLSRARDALSARLERGAIGSNTFNEVTP